MVEKRNYKKNSNTKRSLRTFNIIALIAIAVGIVIYIAWSDHLSKRDYLTNRNLSYMQLTANTTSHHIETYFNEHIEQLLIITKNESFCQEVLKCASHKHKSHSDCALNTLYQINITDIDEVFLVDNSNKIYCSSPSEYDIYEKNYFDNIIIEHDTTHSPYLSVSLIKEEPEIFLIVPIISNEKNVYSIRILLSSNTIFTNTLKEVNNEDTEVWLIDQAGIVISHPVAYHLGKNYLEVHKTKYPNIDWSELESHFETMLTGKEGSGIFHYHKNLKRFSKSGKKVIAYAPVFILDEIWSIGVTRHYSEFELLTNAHTVKTFGLTGILILLFVLGSIFILRNRNKRHLLEVEAESLRESTVILKALKESTESLLESQKVAQIGSYDLDIKEGTWKSSDVLNEIFGINNSYKTDLEGWINIVHPDYQKIMMNYFTKEILTEHKLFNKEYPILRISDKLERWVHGRGKLEFDSQNNPVRMIGVIQDITDRKLSEKGQHVLYNIIKEAKEEAEVSAYDLNERNKEIQGIYSLGLLTEKHETLHEIYSEFVNIIVPQSMQFTDKVYVLLEINNQIYCNKENYNLPKDKKYLSASIKMFKKQIGKLLITYTEDLPFIEIFEQKLIETYAERISKIIEQITTEQELIKAKEKVEESEKKYRSYIDNAPDGIFIANEKGKYVDVNTAACKLTGYSREELLSMGISDITAPEKLNASLQNFKKLAKYGSLGGILKFVKKDGTEYFMQVEAVKLSNYRFLGFTKDVTEHVKAEMELKKMSTAVEQSANCILITNREGEIEYVNNQFTKLTGYTSDEILGENLRFLNSGKQSDEFYQELWNTITTGKEWKGEFLNKKKNGDIYWESATITPVLDENNVIINYIAIKEDISLQKQTEKKILKAIIKTEEREREKFAKEIHDGIGTMLSSINLYLDLFRSSSFDESEKKEFVIFASGLVQETIETTKEIANNLRPNIISRFGLISAIVNHCNKINKTGIFKVSFISKLENEERLQNNEVDIFRIISELLNNSIKHSKAKNVNIELDAMNGFIILNYSDNGIGFNFSDDDIHKKGHGLKNIKSRVSALNGSIKMNSSVGNGFYAEARMLKK